MKKGKVADKIKLLKALEEHTFKLNKILAKLPEEDASLFLKDCMSQMDKWDDDIKDADFSYINNDNKLGRHKQKYPRN